MATKHMNAAPGDFAETVLMPGDPLRAQYITDTYLEDARRVSDVRNMWGFTGTYKGLAVSVMAHGMGIPSASIYCTELITEYGLGNGASLIIMAGIIATMPASISNVVQQQEEAYNTILTPAMLIFNGR